MAYRVVLVEPTHPGNVGAVARAMGNMGVTRLDLVEPVDYLNSEALARSAGNESILHRARVHESLQEAIADCSLIIGTSARVRTIKWPTMSPAKAMEKAVTAVRQGEQVAFVFGQERAGLANEHIDQCSIFVRIPVSDLSPSINLAGAVLIMLYELKRAAEIKQPAAGEPKTLNESSQPEELPANNAQLEGFFGHLERVMRLTGFLSDSPRDSLVRKIRRIFVRSGMSQDDVNIMRGILSSVEYQQSTGWNKSAEDSKSET